MRLWLCFPPSIALGMDKFFWALMSDGRFYTKSTYDLLACPNVQSDPSLRNCLWKIPGRPTTRDLPKNKYCHIRGMAEHNDWPLCDLEPDFELHLRPNVFNMDLATWVELNITLKGVMGVMWIGIFALLKLLTKYGTGKGIGFLIGNLHHQHF